MTTAPTLLTNAQGEVMATSPARIPFTERPGSGFFVGPNHHMYNMAATPPAPPARSVLTAALDARLRPPPTKARDEPGLNPNHPKNRMIVPRTPSGMLWPGHRVGRAVLVEPADPRPDGDGARKRHRASDHVHDARAGEVHRAVAQPRRAAEVGQPAAAPDPAAHQRVDDHAHPEAHEDEAAELQPLRHGARRDGGRGVHEHHLEEEEGQDAADVAHARCEQEPVAAEDPGLPEADQPRAQVAAEVAQRGGREAVRRPFAPMAGKVKLTPPNWKAKPTSQ